MANPQCHPFGGSSAGVHFQCTGCTFYLTTASASSGQHPQQQVANTQPAPAQHAGYASSNQQYYPRPPAKQANLALQPWNPGWQNDFPGSETQRSAIAPITDDEFNDWLQSLPNFDVACPDSTNATATLQQTSQSAAMPVEAHNAAPVQYPSSGADAPGSPDPYMRLVNSGSSGKMQEGSEENDMDEARADRQAKEQDAEGGAEVEHSRFIFACTGLGSSSMRQASASSHGAKPSAASWPKTSAWGRKMPITNKSFEGEAHSKRPDAQAVAGAEKKFNSDENGQWTALDWKDLMGGPYDGTLLP